MQFKNDIEHSIINSSTNATTYSIGYNEHIREKQNGKLYLGNVIEHLPSNCIFDKNNTGCGGTELELRCKRNSIIVVPLRMLIEGKKKQHDTKVLDDGESRVFIEDIYNGKDFTSAIQKYHSGDAKNIKIMVTYESFYKITDYMQFIDTKDWYVLMDEMHLLTDDYSYRENGIDSALKTALLFDNVTYMTATPTMRQFLPVTLEDVPLVSIRWEGEVKPNINKFTTNRPITDITVIAKKYLKGKKGDKNCHIYLNAVCDIIKIAKHLREYKKDIKIVVSSNESNKEKITKEGFEIGSASDDPCKVNLYTSCVFTGVDIYDENGVAFIVSTARSKSTLLNIGTTFIQVMGRIRNTKYRDITHIVSTCGVFTEDMVMYSEYENRINESAEKTKISIDEFNLCKENNPKLSATYVPEFSDFFNMRGGLAVYNDNKRRMALHNYYLLSRVYSSSEGLTNAYMDGGFAYENIRDIKSSIADKIEFEKTDRISWEKKYNAVYNLLEGGELISPDEKKRQLDIFQKNCPSAIQAVKHLTPEIVSELKYKERSVKVRLKKKKNSEFYNGNKATFIRELIKSFKLTRSYLQSDMKRELQNIYNGMGYDKKAKASDIKNWFKVSEKIKIPRDKDGNPVEKRKKKHYVIESIKPIK